MAQTHLILFILICSTAFVGMVESIFTPRIDKDEKGFIYLWYNNKGHRNYIVLWRK
jgi:hypothetical protein